jgi:hypothetical protein
MSGNLKARSALRQVQGAWFAIGVRMMTQGTYAVRKEIPLRVSNRLVEPIDSPELLAE